MGEIAELWASLGARVNQGQWSAADARIAGARRAVDGLDRSFSGAFQDRAGRWRAASGRFMTVRERARLAAQGVEGIGHAADRAGRMAAGVAGGGGGLGGLVNMLGGVRTLAMAGIAWLGSKLVGAGLKVNMTLEDSRNEIAGMLSLAKKTDLADQFGAADTLIANLTKRAATLPGTTADYISMLGNIAQPITDAGLSMQMLEDITVGASVAARALKIDAQVAARDIDQALRGQFHSVDQFTGKLLGAAGFKGEEGRARFNALTQAQRAAKLQEVITSKQIMQLAEAQGKTMSGRLSTLSDTFTQFVGKVTRPLFEALGPILEEANAWFAENEKEIEAAAATIGQVMLALFRGLMWSFGFLGAQAQRLARVAVFVKDAFASLWRVVRDGGSSLWSGLTGVAERVKTAFVEVFAFLGNLPVIREILDKIEWAKSKAGAAGGVVSRVAGAAGVNESQSTLGKIGAVISAPARTVGGAIAGVFSSSTPTLNEPAPAGGTTINVGGVGGITVNPPSGADPRAVAAEVRAAFDERLGEHLRVTKDAL